MHRSHVRSGMDSWGGLLDCRNDVRIRGAAAEVAAHALPDLIVVERHMVRVQIGSDCTRPALLGLAQHAYRRADLSRSTVTTLEGVVRNERALERVQVLAICQALNRDEPGVL